VYFNLSTMTTCLQGCNVSTRISCVFLFQVYSVHSVFQIPRARTCGSLYWVLH